MLRINCLAKSFVYDSSRFPPVELTKGEDLVHFLFPKEVIKDNNSDCSTDFVGADIQHDTLPPWLPYNRLLSLSKEYLISE